MTSLDALATDDGFFTVAALDHRDALRAELARLDGSDGDDTALDGPAVGDAVLRSFKRDLLLALGTLPEAPSAVMLEPEFSLPDLVEHVPAGTGITCALEAQGYLSDPSAGNTLMEGWYPGRVTEVGAHGAKLLVLYRHDRGRFTDDQERLVAEVVTGAAEAGVPVLIEPVPVDVADAADRRDVIVASARRLQGLGPMLLKLPFPGADACEDLTAACGDRPWALLSWGVPFDEYAEQLAIACEAGCSGFTVGRALWREGVDPARRATFATTLLPDRFDQLTTLARTGRPWTAADRRTHPGGPTPEGSS
jgi:tagatose-1,6-bisphosphate aldolase